MVYSSPQCTRLPMRILRSGPGATAAEFKSGPSIPSHSTTSATSERTSDGDRASPIVAIMCIMPAGGSDGDCLFHALAYFDGVLAQDLQLQVAWYMELFAPEQAGFEWEWWQEAQQLKQNQRHDVAAILSAYTLLRQVRIMVHTRVAGNPTPLVMEASHVAVANSDAAPIRHILYNGPLGRYDALVQVPGVEGFEPAWEQQPDPSQLGQMERSETDASSPVEGLESMVWSQAGLAHAGRSSPWDALHQVGAVTDQPKVNNNDITGPRPLLPKRLSEEVFGFVCKVFKKNSHKRWGRLSVWQISLQERCADHNFPCPFWHAILYDLDLALHLEVETFARMLRAEALSLDVLDRWQRRLRCQSKRLWLPRRVWVDYLHRIDLTASVADIRRALAELQPSCLYWRPLNAASGSTAASAAAASSPAPRS